MRKLNEIERLKIIGLHSSSFSPFRAKKKINKFIHHHNQNRFSKFESRKNKPLTPEMIPSEPKLGEKPPVLPSLKPVLQSLFDLL